MSINADEARLIEDMNAEFTEALDSYDYAKAFDLEKRAIEIGYPQMAREWKLKREWQYANTTSEVDDSDELRDNELTH